MPAGRRAQWITGQVMPGDGRGRNLGFPTANLQLDTPANKPPDGIYAGWARILPSDTDRPAVAHIGPRPAFRGAQPSVEIYLIDWPDRDLYGKRISFLPIAKLRPIKKFDTIAELVSAIRADVIAARQALQR